MIKKAHSNYLKLFLVFLVIFGVVGSVIGANYILTGTNIKITGESFAIANKNGKIEEYIEANDPKTGQPTVYTLNSIGEIVPYSIYESSSNNVEERRKVFLATESNQYGIKTITYFEPSTSKMSTLTQETLQNYMPSTTPQTSEDIQAACTRAGLNCGQLSSNSEIQAETTPYGITTVTLGDTFIELKKSLNGGNYNIKIATTDPNTGETTTLIGTTDNSGIVYDSEGNIISGLNLKPLVAVNKDATTYASDALPIASSLPIHAASLLTQPISSYFTKPTSSSPSIPVNLDPKTNEIKDSSGNIYNFNSDGSCCTQVLNLKQQAKLTELSVDNTISKKNPDGTFTIGANPLLFKISSDGTKIISAGDSSKEYTCKSGICNEQSAGNSASTSTHMISTAASAAIKNKEENEISKFQTDWITKNCGDEGTKCPQTCIGKINDGVCTADGVAGSKTISAGYNSKSSPDNSQNYGYDYDSTLKKTIDTPEKKLTLTTLECIKNECNYYEDGKKIEGIDDFNLEEALKDIQKYKIPESEMNKELQSIVVNIQSNPLSLSKEERDAAYKAGYTTNDWSSTYSKLKTTYSDVETAQKNLNDCGTDNECKKNAQDMLKNTQTKLSEVQTLIEQKGDISSALNSMSTEDKKIFLQNYNNKQCDPNGWFTSICKMFKSQTEEQITLIEYNKKVDALNKGKGSEVYKQALNAVSEAEKSLKDACKTSTSDSSCKSATENLEKAKQKQMELYNKELAFIMLNSLGENVDGKLKNALILSGKCSEKITLDCKNEIENFPCNGDASCEQIKKNALASANSGYLKTQVETNIGYDILTTILSPDQNAMSAAKLFGVEADYSNVPKFLSESIPSQICLAKIDGYLDKTKESSVNGQGGLTSYGCSQEYTQVYDEETKKYKKMPQTQCLEVLADLRAQRTQMTPDGKTAISYSYYIKAPPNTELKYIVAISYVEGSTIKKQTIVPLTKTSGIKNGFDSVELFLNASDGEINENSFTINLLAIYDNNEVYQKLSYSIPPITTGDSYSTPIPAQVANSNGANSGSSSNQNVKAELSTEDMLAMI